MRISKVKTVQKSTNKPKRFWQGGRFLQSKKFQKRFAVTFVSLVVLFIAVYLVLLRPALKVYADVKSTSHHIKSLKDSLILQDLDATSAELKALTERVDDLDRDTAALAWTGNIPFLGNYYKDGQHGLVAARHGIKTGQIIIEAVTPFADILGFKTKTTGASLDAQQKVAGLVKAMPQIVTRMDDISVEMSAIHSELDQIDPNRYPESFRGQPIRPLLAQAKSSMSQIEDSMPDIKEFLTVLPSALGSPEQKTYLVLFQNDKELRPTGGFITAYALVTIKDGRVISVTSDDIYHLDVSIKNHPAPPAVLAEYLKVKEYNARDTNLSPDFFESVKEFEKFWVTAPNAAKIDGVIGLDTYVVQDLLKVLGPVKLSEYDEPFTADNVVYQLELYANLLMKFQWDRKDLLGRLMNEIMNKAFHAPREQWKPLIDSATNLSLEKHLIFNLHDSKVQSLAETYNYAGRIKTFEGDYLHINDSNFAGAKANLYVQETVNEDYRIESNGKITKTVTITLKNPEKADGWLNGLYYDWMRIYVPKGSKLISNETWREVKTYDELGKTVFETYTYCYPEQSNTVKIVYELPFTAKKGDDLNLLIQKQPGTDAHTYKIAVNGKETDSFNLKSDRETTIHIP